MRIISGTFSGRAIRGPDSDKTRPITDRAKQSLFDALQNCFESGNVLDCFAGTGSMGLECLSRGAAHVTFIEKDRSALKLLKENLTEFAMDPRAAVLPIDAYALPLQHPDIQNLTIAFVDPPYAHMTGQLRNKVDRLVQQLAASAMVDGGIISLRHPMQVSVDPAALGVKIVRELHYGEMAITWLTKA